MMLTDITHCYYKFNLSFCANHHVKMFIKIPSALEIV